MCSLRGKSSQGQDRKVSGLTFTYEPLSKGWMEGAAGGEGGGAEGGGGAGGWAGAGEGVTHRDLHQGSRDLGFLRTARSRGIETWKRRAPCSNGSLTVHVLRWIQLGRGTPLRGQNAERHRFEA